MRLEGQSKLGYYPTPDVSLSLALTWLRISDEKGLRRYLDPCCGKGEALAAIATACGPAETYGIELSDVRAAEAEHVLQQVINTAYEYAVLADETFSCVLLNPPYDGEGLTGGGKRLEETFLLDTTPRLMPGGVLLYIIPHQRINERVARHLAGWYDDLRCFKLAAGDYEVFDQIIVFGVRRKTYAPASGDDLRAVQAWADAQIVIGYTMWPTPATPGAWAEQIEVVVEGEQTAEGQPKRKKVRQPVYGDLPELVAGQGAYAIPVSPLRGPRGAFRFQFIPVTDEDRLRVAQDCVAQLEQSRDWLDLIPRLTPPVIEPAMTPKKGHIAMQVNGGLLGTNLVRAPDQTPLLIKGNVCKTSKTIVHHPDEDPTKRDDGKDHLSKVEVRQQFETALATLDTQGELQITSHPETIKQLLDLYVEQLAEIVQARNVPQYDMKPEPWEWAVFDNLSKDRKLPGRDETGLTEFQKHLAIALGRLCLKYGAGVITAEMGSGKAQPLHAKLLTPNGWCAMGDIHVGDDVISADGRPTRVVGVYPQGEKDIYRVTFTDDSQVECCADHLWTVQTPLNKWKGKSPTTLTLHQMMEKGLAHVNGNLKFFIPLVEPVRFASRDLPIDPYVLGALLGDGSISSGKVGLTTADAEILDNVSYALPGEVYLKQIARYTWYVTSGSRKGPHNGKNPVLSALQKMGLMGHTANTKFIPFDYLFGSVAQRVSLLQGLLDTDGTVNRNSSTIEYATISPQLADDVTALVQSLGGTVTRRIKTPTFTYHNEKRVGQKAYRLFIALGDRFPPFRLSRKMAIYRKPTKYQPTRAIKAIEKIGRLEAQCIKVAARDGLYVTDNFVVTHNSTVFLAIVEYLRAAQDRRGRRVTAYPALIVGPGVVTGAENWPKEIADVIPGAASRVITIGAKPVSKTVKIGQWLRRQFISNPLPQTEVEQQQFTLELTAAAKYIDDSEFEGLSPEGVIDLLRRVTRRIEDKDMRARFGQRIKHALTPLTFTLKTAWKNPPRRRPHAKDTNLLDARIGGLLWLDHDLPRDDENAREIASRYSLFQFAADYRSGVLAEKSFAVLSYETAKLGSGRVPAMTTRRVRVKYRDERDRVQSELVEVCTCPTCGAVVVEEYDLENGEPIAGKTITPAQAVEWVGLRRRFCQAPRPRRVWDEERGKQVTLTVDEDGERYVCGAPLFEVSELRRMPAATVARHLKKFFGALGVDEVHKCKAKGTGVGWALTVLNNACRFTTGLTGTLFGGYSTSIFWLMYRLSGEVRREFGYSDERRWVEKYGLLKTTFYVDNPKALETEDGAYTGTREYLSVSEMPGISPAIAGIGLKYCTFSSLNDIGLPLPDYSEEIVRLEMTEAMKAQMKEADGQPDETDGLFLWAMQRKQEEDGKGAISVWLNTALNRPDAMFRGEHVVFHPRVSGRGRFAIRGEESVKTFAPVVGPGEWLPKETWTAHQCLLERDQGFKTLIGVRQTGERDIQPRLAEALEAVGLRTGILRPSLAPAKRATWIKHHAHEFDVLLTNARLVEVGLNLTMFNTAILYEFEWSLYVMWQFMRRLYRPGASKRVKLYFPVYQDTLEESALDLLGHKMLAAQLFYGDNVGGALVEELDDGDLLGDLVRKAMGKLNIGRAEGIFTIGNKPVVTASPLGSPTLPSPQLKTFAELSAVRQTLLAPRRLPTRRMQMPEDQMSLF